MTADGPICNRRFWQRLPAYVVHFSAAAYRLPNPWHIVTVQPRTVGGKTGTVGQGTGHRYRYDVMGFPRRGRHRLKDGTYRETVEWVRPHQRGIKNQTYIPKVSRFEAGLTPGPNDDGTS